MGSQEGMEHTQLLTAGQLHQSPMPEAAVSEQPGHQEKEASLASLLRSHPAGERTSLEGTSAGLVPRELGHCSCAWLPAHFALFLLCTHIPVNTSPLLDFPKCLSLDLGMVVYMCNPSYSGSRDRRTINSRTSWAA